MCCVVRVWWQGTRISCGSELPRGDVAPCRGVPFSGRVPCDVEA